MAYDFDLIKVEIESGVATATIDNPPINVITLPLYMELIALTEALEQDASLSVVLLKSADPDFFIAHFDVAALLEMPIDTDPERSDELNPFHQMCRRFQTMDKVTIAQIEGRVGGGGNELASNCDMRFGVRGKTRINQMEVGLGILPGGTGTQQLPRLIGRNRAMEVILGGEDLDAEKAEKWGYLNRIFEADEISPFVQQLCRRIAAFPQEAVRLAKQSINCSELPLDKGLIEEAYLFQRLLRTRDAQDMMQKFLESGGQTREGELKVDELISNLQD